MDAARARDDVAFLREVIGRARRRVDPHAFHMVLWGALVLVWYPLLAWLQDLGRTGAMAWVGGSALFLGFAGSTFLERRLGGRPRLEGEDPTLGRLVGWIVFVNIGAGFVLSAVLSATHVLAGEHVPIVWGLVYASLGAHVGLVYSREFLWAGLAMFVGTCVAAAVPAKAGYVLGPVMGFGMIVPGWIAERRVRAMRREEEARGASA